MKTWRDIERATSAQIIEWAEGQSWARDMATCQQDPLWHAEGDVWTHTKMVCAELERLAEWKGLDRATQIKLLLASLFHDAGKPVTTAIDPETGHVRSPRHASVGAEIARRVLRALGSDLIAREEIGALIQFHGRPPYLFERVKPEHDVITLSWFVNNRLLYLLALADTRGRRTKDMTRPEDSLHLWKLLAEEYGCFDRRYAFANDQARFLFYREQLSSLHYVPHEEYRCTVTLMSGLPGAGKDTWLAKHRPALPVVALDTIREEIEIEATDNQGEVVQMAREKCREHLRAGRSFAFNATNITRQIRRRWINLFADYSGKIEIVYVEPPEVTIVAQNKRRPNPVPEKVMLRLLEKIEVPTITECHSLIVV